MKQRESYEDFKRRHGDLKLPPRKTWRDNARKVWLRCMWRFPGDLIDTAEKHDTCTNEPRQPHTQTVLYARDVWVRPAKLEPFKTNLHPDDIIKAGDIVTDGRGNIWHVVGAKITDKNP